MEAEIRIGKMNPSISEVKVFSPKTLWEHPLMGKVKEYDREALFLILLNTRQEILGVECHSLGTINYSPVYPREIVKSAILGNASAVVMVHNHPGGDPEPGWADKSATSEVVYACALFKIDVLDHVIFGNKTYYSFTEHNESSLAPPKLPF